MALDAAQEKFCANIVKGMTKKQAYVDAYPGVKMTSAAVLASNLAKKPEIMARIADIKTEVRADTNITIHTIIDELEDARQEAKKSESPNLMMKASLLKAKLLGFVDDDKGLGPGLAIGSVAVGIADLKALKDKLNDNNDD